MQLKRAIPCILLLFSTSISAFAQKSDYSWYYDPFPTHPPQKELYFGKVKLIETTRFDKAYANEYGMVDSSSLKIITNRNTIVYDTNRKVIRHISLEVNADTVSDITYLNRRYFLINKGVWYFPISEGNGNYEKFVYTNIDVATQTLHQRVVIDNLVVEEYVIWFIGNFIPVKCMNLKNGKIVKTEIWKYDSLGNLTEDYYFGAGVSHAIKIKCNDRNSSERRTYSGFQNPDEITEKNCRLIETAVERDGVTLIHGERISELPKEMDKYWNITIDKKNHTWRSERDQRGMEFWQCDSLGLEHEYLQLTKKKDTLIHSVTFYNEQLDEICSRNANNQDSYHTFDYVYDEKGNWTLRKEFVNGCLNGMIQRRFEYYP